MKWCCPGFEGFYGQAGQRGAAVLVGRNSIGEPEFTMQYRAADAGDEQSINSETLMSPIVDVGMQYCPWCGRRLDKWYGKSVDALFRSDLKITYS
jgi:uncharacterized protein (UPF0212 family)